MREKSKAPPPRLQWLRLLLISSSLSSHEKNTASRKINAK